MFFKSKKAVQEAYDKNLKTPVIHASICTGEQVAGFKDNKTGVFEEVMLITSDKDLKDFMNKYGITEPIKKEY